MPTISIFFGIVITINFRDHNPPHIHAEYQGHSATFDIRSGNVTKGYFPQRLVGIVHDWILEYQDALLDNWERAKNRLPLNKVPGADA